MLSQSGASRQISKGGFAGIGTLVPGLGNSGLGAWSGPGSDPGAPYTREKLKVPYLTTSNYLSLYPDWVGDPPSQSDLDKIMDDMYKYRLCWWAGICDAVGYNPFQPYEQGTPDYSQVNTQAQQEIQQQGGATGVTILPTPPEGFIEEPYPGSQSSPSEQNDMFMPSVFDAFTGSTIGNFLTDPGAVISGGQVEIAGKQIPGWLVIGGLGIGGYLLYKGIKGR